MDSEDFTSKKLSTKLLQQIQVGLLLLKELTFFVSIQLSAGQIDTPRD